MQARLEEAEERINSEAKKAQEFRAKANVAISDLGTQVDAVAVGNAALEAGGLALLLPGLGLSAGGNYSC